LIKSTVEYSIFETFEGNLGIPFHLKHLVGSRN